ncbi:GP3 protein [RtMc arterivirus]|uniref:GP3 protein n=1 Tax=RtMc arterivirus TaxID=2847274 RepID=A0A2H4MWN8_9NIDO|nr:GP3 protein [Rodent arterivirus]ATP66631.1 GP3 protein [RtMc arterivirus]
MYLPLMNQTYVNWTLSVNISTYLAHDVLCAIPTRGSRQAGYGPECAPFGGVESTGSYLETISSSIPEDMRPHNLFSTLAVMSFVMIASYYPQVFSLYGVENIILVPHNTSIFEGGDSKDKKQEEVKYEIHPYGHALICAEAAAGRNTTEVNATHFVSYIDRLHISEAAFRKEWVRPFFSCWLVLWVSIFLRGTRASRVTVRHMLTAPRSLLQWLRWQ